MKTKQKYQLSSSMSSINNRLWNRKNKQSIVESGDKQSIVESEKQTNIRKIDNRSIEFFLSTIQ